MAGWNYRVMRHVENGSANQEVYYAIHEVHYDEDGSVKGWTTEPSGGPFGGTLSEMVRDLAWIMTALVKPVLEHTNGREVEPAAMMADDLTKMIADGEIRNPTSADRPDVDRAEGRKP